MVFGTGNSGAWQMDCVQFTSKMMSIFLIAVLQPKLAPEIQEVYVWSRARSHKDGALRIKIGNFLCAGRSTARRKSLLSVAIKETLIGFLWSYHWFK